MNAKNIGSAVTVVVGLGLIIGGYLYWGESLDGKTKLLDILVTFFLFFQFFKLVLFPWIQGERPVSGDAARMKRHFYGLHLCALVAIATIVLGILLPIPFKYQLLIQVFVFFFILVGRAAILHAGERIVKEYQEEGLIKKGEINPRETFLELVQLVDADAAVAPVIAGKLHELEETVAQIQPSTKNVAKLLDNQFVLAVADLKVMIRKGEHNKERLEKGVSYLGLLLARRKSHKF